MSAVKYATVAQKLSSDDVPRSGVAIMLVGVWSPFIVLLGCIYVLSPCEEISNVLMGVLAASAALVIIATPILVSCTSPRADLSLRALRKDVAFTAASVGALIVLVLRSRVPCNYPGATAHVSISAECKASTPVCAASMFSVTVDGPKARIRRGAESFGGPIAASDNAELWLALVQRNATSYTLRAHDMTITYDVPAHTAHASFGVVGAWDTHGHQLRLSLGSSPPLQEFRYGDVWLSIAKDGATLDYMSTYDQQDAVLVPHPTAATGKPCAAFCAEQFMLGQAGGNMRSARVLFPLGLFMLTAYDVHVYDERWDHTWE